MNLIIYYVIFYVGGLINNRLNKSLWLFIINIRLIAN